MFYAEVIFLRKIHPTIKIHLAFVVFSFIAFLLIAYPAFGEMFISGFPEKKDSWKKVEVRIVLFEKYGFVGSSNYFVLYKTSCLGLFQKELDRSRRGENCLINFEESSVKFDSCKETFK